MFYGCNKFNMPLNDWNVGKVTNMEKMFFGCYRFDQSLNDWNVGNVTNMKEMFATCASFNKPLDKWDVQNVTTMEEMFLYCENFNQSLDNWDVHNVTNMNEMFYGCEKLDKPVYWYNINRALLAQRPYNMFTPPGRVSKLYPHFDKGIGLLTKNPSKYKLERKQAPFAQRNKFERLKGEATVKNIRRPDFNPNPMESVMLMGEGEIANTIGSFLGPMTKKAKGGKRKTRSYKKRKTMSSKKRKTKASKKRRY